MKLILLLLFFLSFSSAKFINSSPKIINGRDADFNEFPYIVSIRRAELEMILDLPFHICGGSIIDSNTVLTASHCLFDSVGNQLTEPESFFVVAGFLRLFTEYANSSRFLVTKIYSHPNFNTQTLDNDIAILKVAPTFSFNLLNIQPIQIETNLDLDEGTECSVHGWGVLYNDYPVYPDFLQTVDIKISNFENCYYSYDESITVKQLCASDTDKDSCYGDSGGPLVCNNVLVGIVSFGNECAQPNYPGVYTKVAAYQDFIQNYSILLSRASLPKLLLTNIGCVLSFLVILTKSHSSLI